MGVWGNVLFTYMWECLWYDGVMFSKVSSVASVATVAVSCVLVAVVCVAAYLAWLAVLLTGDALFEVFL